jgi:hypothetical protein
MPPELAAIRRRLALSATAALAGIAASVAMDPALGGWITVAAVASLIFSLHRFGRTGPA